MKRHKVWNTQGQFIGEFELPENPPRTVLYDGRIFSHHRNFNVFIEQPNTEVYEVGILFTSNPYSK